MFALFAGGRTESRLDGEDFATNFCGHEWVVALLLLRVPVLSLLPDGGAQGIEVMIIFWFRRIFVVAGD